MDDKIVIVTGANTGLGKETARELARMGATVALVCRSEETGEAARREIIASTGNDNISLYLADFASLSQVRRVGEQLLADFSIIDVLVNNAGLIIPQRIETEDGYEATMAINHLAPFLLTNILLDHILAAPAGRIVNVASNAHTRGAIDREDFMSTKNYSGMKVYGTSKLANILFTRELSRRLEGTNATTNTLHPGVIATNFGRDFTGITKWIYSLARIFFKGPVKGAQTTIYLASSPTVNSVSGEYFVDSIIAPSSEQSSDVDLARWLWAESERLVANPANA